jgi:hypothetical protein
MTDLIVSVVGDVLRHIAVEYQEPRDVIWSEPSDDFLAVEFQIDWRLALIGRSAEFGVLNPQVGLDLLQGAQEGQNCDVALGDWRAILVPPNAAAVPGSRDAPMVAAPAATIPFVRKARRFVPLFMLFSDFFIVSPLLQEN